MLKLSYKNLCLKFDTFPRRNGSFFPSKSRRWESKKLINIYLFVSSYVILDFEFCFMRNEKEIRFIGLVLISWVTLIFSIQNPNWTSTQEPLIFNVPCYLIYNCVFFSRSPSLFLLSLQQNPFLECCFLAISMHSI